MEWINELGQVRDMRCGIHKTCHDTSDCDKCMGFHSVETEQEDCNESAEINNDKAYSLDVQYITIELESLLDVMVEEVVTQEAKSLIYGLKFVIEETISDASMDTEDEEDEDYFFDDWDDDEYEGLI